MKLHPGPKVLDHWGVSTSDFSPLPIFNVDPYRTGTDSTVEPNIETGWEGENCIWIQELGETILSENRQKFNVSAVNDEWS